MYKLNRKEAKTLQKIAETYYMKPALDIIQNRVNNSLNKRDACKELFNALHDILIDSKEQVDELLNERLENGEICSVEQARKSIAGNAFSKLVIYTFIKNKVVGTIRPDIFITSKKSDIKNFDDIATINVGDEMQKPDVDLIIYTKKESGEVNKCIILSLKTSLRERAWQTYKWKLLMEIAATENPIKEKYNINYNAKNMPLVCFATVNFYDEINSPQYRGMFKFFDNSFIGKPINENFINALSNIVNYVNDKL